jgi:hypothetical protein
VDQSTEAEDLAAQSTRELELLDKKFSKKKKKKKRPTEGNAMRVNQNQAPRPESQAPRAAEPPQAATPQNRPTDANSSPRQGDKRKKHKNKPRPNFNAGPTDASASKGESPAPKPNNPSETPKRFPPRINQGPSGTEGND